MNQVLMSTGKRMRYVVCNVTNKPCFHHILLHQKRLYFTLRTENIPIQNIAGKCYVQHPSAIQDLDLWLHHEDHFYVQDCSVKPPFIRIEDCNELRVMDLYSHSYCTECYKEHMENISEQRLLVQGHRPLQTLELFSGSLSISPCICNISNNVQEPEVSRSDSKMQGLLRPNGQLSMRPVLQKRSSMSQVAC